VVSEGSAVTASTTEGLSDDEAARRLTEYGPNSLPPPQRISVWRQLLAQFVHFFAIMLWCAGALAIVGGLPELGIAIFVVILVNGVFAFVQEHRAEQAADRLRDLLPQRVIVIRDDRHLTVDASLVVPGDLLLLAGGDRICGDLDCVESHGLLIDTSTLTGESVPDSVDVGGVMRAGSFVVEGEGLAVVTATGSATRLAEIARLTQGPRRPDTPLTRELHRLVRTIAAIAVGVGVSFFLLMVFVLDRPARDGFIFAIGVTVALVPEGLLPTVTLSLAIGAQNMAKHNALVRRLEAVETLGSTTFICTDKTGTLTQNQMNIVEVWTPAGSARIDGRGYDPEAQIRADPAVMDVLADLGVAARRCSTGHAQLRDGRWVPQGDPMEAAIDAFARRVGAPVEERIATDGELRRFSFDPRRRRSSVLTRGEVLVKGAPDSVFAQCTSGSVDDATRATDELTARGLRVLAVARRTWEGVAPSDAVEAEQRLELLGVLGLQDPPRRSAADAVAACRLAGIQLAMITGDHPATAAAIGAEVGLYVAGAPVLIGTDLPADDDELAELVDHDGAIIARVTPEDKLRIAKALRRRGHVLAMTGDGVNDGPALREADIGVAMGASGTDVAREAADLVLLDDDFATVVAAVRQGRATFANARRFLTYHLTDNVAELTPFIIWALSGTRFPLALGVLQILALDIGTDTLSAVALGAEPPSEGILDRPPISGRLLNRTVALRAFGVLGPTEAVFEMTAFVTALVVGGWRPSQGLPSASVLATGTGAAFLAVVFAQKANAFCCRSSTRPPWKLGWTTNRLLIIAAAVELLFAACLVLIPALADLLKQAVPPVAAWVVILASIPGLFAVDWAAKRWMGARRRGAT